MELTRTNRSLRAASDKGKKVTLTFSIAPCRECKSDMAMCVICTALFACDQSSHQKHWRQELEMSRRNFGMRTLAHRQAESFRAKA